MTELMWVDPVTADLVGLDVPEGVARAIGDGAIVGRHGGEGPRRLAADHAKGGLRRPPRTIGAAHAELVNRWPQLKAIRRRR